MSPKKRKGSRRRRKQQRRRRILLGFGIAGFLFLVVAGFAYQELQQERVRLDVLTAEIEDVVRDPAIIRDPAARATARDTLRGATVELEGAASRLRGSLSLRIAGLPPVLSRQRSGVLDLIDDGAVAADVGMDLLEALDTIETEARSSTKQLPLDALAEAQSVLASAGKRLAAVQRGSSGLIGPLRHARGDFDDVAKEQGDRVGALAEQLASAHSFLGGAGARRYFLALENNAEMRARGMVLSFAEVGFDGGSMSVSGATSVDDVTLEEPVDVPLPPGTEQVFGGQAPTRLFQAVNATADFALTGKILQAMHRQASGTEVGGVIGLDVVALASLLEVTGPIETPETPEPLTSANVADVLLRDFYADLPSGPQGQRRERLAVVAAAIAGRLTAGGYDLFELAEAVATSARQGHLRLWSATAKEEAAFERAGVAGSVSGARPDRTMHVTVQNATATKLDYFVRPSVAIDVTITPDETAIIRTTVTIANTAPEGAQASYQLGPDKINSFTPGEYVANVFLWGPAGSVQPNAIEESGLQVSAASARALAGTSASVEYVTLIDNAVRNGRFDLRLVPQPRLHPMPLSVKLTAPGRTVGAAPEVPTWDQSLTISWQIR